MRIAILGASSHVARSLIPFMTENEVTQLNRVDEIIGDYDMLINCVGVRKSADVNFSDYFFLTEKYDNMCLDYLDASLKTKYIFFSTGAVHYFKGVKDINNDNCCAIAKINAEAKHRALPHLNIVDIRLYSYFSNHANLNEPYLINEIVRAIKEKKQLITSAFNSKRNYVRPYDLYKFIISVKGNGAREVGSCKNVDKKSLLRYFSDNYGLKYEMNSQYKAKDITGFKLNYVPPFTENETKWTSLMTIREAAHEILGR